MSKVIFFRGFTDTPLKVVKDQRGVSGCQKCYFQHNPGGCPTSGEERRAGSGYCETDGHHYQEHECDN